MKRSISVCVLAIAATTALAACSSSGGSGSPGANTAAAVPPSTGSASQAGSAAAASAPSGADAAVAAAQADIDKYTAKPTFTAPNDSFDVKSLAGKTIAIVAIDQTTPSLQLVASGIKEAAGVAGLKTTLFDAKDNPSDMTAGIEQAIAAHVGAIVLDGVPVELVSSQIAAAAAANIPVVNADNSRSDLKGGLYANATPDFQLQGKLAAEAAIVATKGKAKAIVIGTAGITPGQKMVNGFTSALKACSTCEILSTKTVQIQDWFTTLKSTTTALVQSNPSVNVMLPIYVTMALQMVPAIQQAGAADKISIFSTSAPPDAAKLLESTPILKGLASQSDTQVGWFAANQAMRGMLKLAPSTAWVPTRYITPETVKSEGTSQDALFGSDYRDGYKKLWGLQ